MNYLHEFHAGNFADVMKHAIFYRVLRYFNEKPKPYFVLDTHAGAGRYDLKSEAADRNPEYRNGIGALYDQNLADLSPVLADYVQFVRDFNEGGSLRHYPGSPIWAALTIRECDRFLAIEKNPSEFQKLIIRMREYPAARCEKGDGYAALNAYLPPKEKRGVIIMDPPFEDRNEFEILLEALRRALKKFSTGTYLIWVPDKSTEALQNFQDAFTRLAPKYAIFEHETPENAAAVQTKLVRTALFVINPPYILQDTPFTKIFNT